MSDPVYEESDEDIANPDLEQEESGENKSDDVRLQPLTPTLPRYIYIESDAMKGQV